MSPYTEYIASKGVWVEIPGDPNDFISFGGELVPGAGDGTTTPTVPTTPTTPAPSFTLETVPNTIMRLDPRTMGNVDTSVSSWTDPVSAKVFSVPTGATGPTVKADPNGRKMLRFNGFADRLVLTGSIIDSAKPFTIYAAVRMARASRGVVFSQALTTATNRGVLISCAGANDIRGLRMNDDGAIARATKGLHTDSWQIITITSANANSVGIRAQEIVGTPQTPTTPSTTGFTTDTVSFGVGMSRIASRVGKFTDAGEFDLGTFIICDALHDAETIAATEHLLSDAMLIGLPSRGGTVNNVNEVIARRAEKTIAEGYFVNHPITGEAMGVFENTGVDPSVTLTRFEGTTFKTTSDNQLIENMRINADISNGFKNVKFKNCVIVSSKDPKTGAGSQPYDSVVTYENCEIAGGDEDSGTALGYNRYRATNCWIHDCEDGIRLGNDAVATRCLVTHLSHALLDDGTRVHADSVQSNAVNNPDGVWTTVENCTLPGRRDNGTKGNSAFILNNEQNYTKRIRCRANLVGSGSYTVFITASPFYAEQFELIDNYFIGDGQDGDMWLPDKSQSGFVTLTNNKRADGQPLKIYRTVLKTAGERKYDGTNVSPPMPVSPGV